MGSKLGEDYLAINTILMQFVILSAFFLDAYAFSTEGIVGYSIGSKNKKILTNVIKNSFILSATTGLLISIIYLLGKNHFISIMTDLPEIKNLSMSHSYWIVIIPFISSFCLAIKSGFLRK